MSHELAETNRQLQTPEIEPEQNPQGLGSQVAQGGSGGDGDGDDDPSRRRNSFANPLYNPGRGYRPIQQSRLLQLQRTVGNRAVTRLIEQGRQNPANSPTSVQRTPHPTSAPAAPTSNAANQPHRVMRHGLGVYAMFEGDSVQVYATNVMDAARRTAGWLQQTHFSGGQPLLLVINNGVGRLFDGNGRMANFEEFTLRSSSSVVPGIYISGANSHLYILADMGENQIVHHTIPGGVHLNLPQAFTNQATFNRAIQPYIASTGYVLFVVVPQPGVAPNSSHRDSHSRTGTTNSHSSSPANSNSARANQSGQTTSATTPGGSNQTTTSSPSSSSPNSSSGVTTSNVDNAASSPAGQPQTQTPLSHSAPGANLSGQHVPTSQPNQSPPSGQFQLPSDAHLSDHSQEGDPNSFRTTGPAGQGGTRQLGPAAPNIGENEFRSGRNGANAPAYPATITGPEFATPGSITNYHMGLVAPHPHAVNYRWERYEITEAFRSGEEQTQEVQQYLTNRPASSEDDPGALQGLGERWNQAGRDHQQDRQQSRADLRRSLHGDNGDGLLENGRNAIANLISIALEDVSGTIRTAGCVYDTAATLLGFDRQDYDMVWPRSRAGHQRVYLIRALAQPDPQGDWQPAASVAVKVVRVMPMEMAARNSLDQPEGDISNLENQLRQAESSNVRNPALIQTLHEQLEDARLMAGGTTEEIIRSRWTRVHREMERNPRLTDLDWEHYAALERREQELHNMLQVLARRGEQFANEPNPHATVRVRASFVNQNDGQALPLLLDMHLRAPLLEGERYQCTLSDVTTTGGSTYAREGSTAMQSFLNAHRYMAGQFDYGRGLLSIRIPENLPGGFQISAGDYSETANPRNTRLAHQNLERLVQALAALGLVASTAGTASAVLGGVLAAEHLISRWQDGNLFGDQSAVDDLSAVLGGLVPGMQAIAGLRILQQGGRFRLLVQRAQQAQRAISGTATLISRANNAYSMAEGPVSIIDQILEANRQEREGEITPSAARAARARAIASGINFLAQQIVNSAHEEQNAEHQNITQAPGAPRSEQPQSGSNRGSQGPTGTTPAGGSTPASASGSHPSGAQNPTLPGRASPASQPLTQPHSGQNTPGRVTPTSHGDEPGHTPNDTSHSPSSTQPSSSTQSEGNNATRPNLRPIQGGGEGDGIPRGRLRAVGQAEGEHPPSPTTEPNQAQRPPEEQELAATGSDGVVTIPRRGSSNSNNRIGNSPQADENTPRASATRPPSSGTTPPSEGASASPTQSAPVNPSEQNHGNGNTQTGNQGSPSQPATVHNSPASGATTPEPPTQGSQPSPTGGSPASSSQQTGANLNQGTANSGANSPVTSSGSLSAHEMDYLRGGGSIGRGLTDTEIGAIQRGLGVDVLRMFVARNERLQLLHYQQELNELGTIEASATGIINYVQTQSPSQGRAAAQGSARQSWLRSAQRLQNQIQNLRSRVGQLLSQGADPFSDLEQGLQGIRTAEARLRASIQDHPFNERLHLANETINDLSHPNHPTTNNVSDPFWQGFIQDIDNLIQNDLIQPMTRDNLQHLGGYSENQINELLGVTPGSIRTVAVRVGDMILIDPSLSNNYIILTTLIHEAAHTRQNSTSRNELNSTSRNELTEEFEAHAIERHYLQALIDGGTIRRSELSRDHHELLRCQDDHALVEYIHARYDGTDTQQLAPGTTMQSAVDRILRRP